MRSKLNRLLCLLVLALPASAQLDSARLRVKFGVPLSREIFRVPPGFDLVVDYGAGNQVCMLQVPTLMPTNAQVQNDEDMKQKMYAFLAELAPDLMRGKELQRLMSTVGLSSVRFAEYEHVTIVETYSPAIFLKWAVYRLPNDTITVRFKDAGCQQTEQIAR